jgi:phosphoglycerate kinase
MSKLTIKDLAVRGKRVFLRVDYNVPMEEKDGQMVINDLTRIRATLPTLDHLIEQGARIILAAHLGRPKGKREPSMSLRPVAAQLADLLGRPVAFVDDCIGEKAEQTAGALKEGDLLLLENVRYHAQEEANDPVFAAQLADLADIYVNDAFGAAHRAHASTEGIARIIAERGGPCAAGLLMQKELQFLGDELESPAHPFVVILGGAKVSDKIKVIDRLLDKADALLVGGAMTYTFSLAQGRKVGRSLVEPDRVEMARGALDKAAARGVKFLLPVDHVVATPEKTDKLDKKGKPILGWQQPHTVDSVDIPEAEAGLDIGPNTIRDYQEAIATAKTILWNGPMGMFEEERFAAGTFAVAQAVADATQNNGAKSIIGGGDSVKALNKSGLADRVTFVSTGGGASLEFLEGRELPGVAVLSNL